jgi:hypothetical protein
VTEASHPHYLSRSAERALAATALTAATRTDPAVTSTLVDALDLASGGILAAAGPVDRDQARAVLSIMWSLTR